MDFSVFGKALVVQRATFFTTRINNQVCFADDILQHMFVKAAKRDDATEHL